MTEKKSMLDGEKQYHIGLAPGDVADFVILPGDPGRVEFIAGHFDDAKEIAFNREYKTFTGTYKGRPVSVMSTGMGCPSTAIGVEELANIGVKTMVRLGTSGAMQEHTRVGDLVIANGAVRQEGTSTEYMQLNILLLDLLTWSLRLNKLQKIREALITSVLCKQKILFMGNMTQIQCPFHTT